MDSYEELRHHTSSLWAVSENSVLQKIRGFMNSSSTQNVMKNMNLVAQCFQHPVGMRLIPVLERAPLLK